MQKMLHRLKKALQERYENFINMKYYISLFAESLFISHIKLDVDVRGKSCKCFFVCLDCSFDLFCPAS